MSCTLNKVAWEKLIDENINWLDKQPDTLECKHIREILEWVKSHRPDKQTDRIKELENLLVKVYDEKSFDKVGEWITSNIAKKLQDKVKQSLKFERIEDGIVDKEKAIKSLEEALDYKADYVYDFMCKKIHQTIAILKE